MLIILLFVITTKSQKKNLKSYLKNHMIIDGDGTPYDSSIELSADDFEYIRNLYNEYVKNHQ